MMVPNTQAPPMNKKIQKICEGTIKRRASKDGRWENMGTVRELEKPGDGVNVS